MRLTGIDSKDKEVLTTRLQRAQQPYWLQGLITSKQGLTCEAIKDTIKDTVRNTLKDTVRDTDFVPISIFKRIRKTIIDINID